MNFIEEFYYGNIDPQASDISPYMRKQMQRLGDAEELLTKRLTGDEKAHFADYSDAWAAVNSESNRNSFVTGFRLGAMFVMDTFFAEDKAWKNT